MKDFAANCGQTMMNRITQLDPVYATGITKQLFEAVQTKLGVVPNLFRVLGVSPAALQGYLHFNDALAGGALNSKVREQIALVVAEGNMCTYCLSAHTFIGGKVGLTEKDIAEARHAKAASQKTDAILKLARRTVR
jgi:AhpD family alkylhydroperoxidase